MSTPKHTAAHLKASLIEHIRASGAARRSNRTGRQVPAWIAVDELTLGQAGAQRADVYALEMLTHTLNAVIYEVKVSRADFLHDVNEGKYRGYLKHASRVLFAVPAGLIRRDEIPSDAGMIEYRGDMWRVTKSGRRTEAGWGDIPLLQLLWRAMDTGPGDPSSRLRRIQANDHMKLRDLAKMVGREVGVLKGYADTDAERLDESKQAIEQLLGKNYTDVPTAIHHLDRFVRLQYPGIERIGLATTLLEAASEAVGSSSGFSFGQERLARQLEEAAAQIRSTKES